MVHSSENYSIHEVVDTLTAVACHKPITSTNNLATEDECLKSFIEKHNEMLSEMIRMSAAFSTMAKAIRYKMKYNNATSSLS